MMISRTSFEPLLSKGPPEHRLQAINVEVMRCHFEAEKLLRLALPGEVELRDAIRGERGV